MGPTADWPCAEAVDTATVTAEHESTLSEHPIGSRNDRANAIPSAPR
jgi:hypothetical protein